MNKKYKIYYDLLMQRARIMLLVTVGGWGMLIGLNIIEHLSVGTTHFVGLARIWFITIIPAVIYYIKARKLYRCKEPKEMKVKYLGTKSTPFDISCPHEYKRPYGIVSIKKKKYKCLECEGIPKGAIITCLRFNNTFIPKFGDAKHATNNT